MITSLRPPMTAADGLIHLIGALRTVGGQLPADVAALLCRLEEISEQLARHNTSADPQRAAALRASGSAGTGPDR